MLDLCLKRKVIHPGEVQILIGIATQKPGIGSIYQNGLEAFQSLYDF